MFGGFVIFSRVEGVVLRKGAPASGVRVKRKFFWGVTSERFEEFTTTDASGRFSFEPIIRQSLLARLMPHQPSINQTIAIEDGETFRDGWVKQKLNYAENGELGRPIRLRCDLGSTEVRQDDFYGFCDLA